MPITATTANGIRNDQGTLVVDHLVAFGASLGLADGVACQIQDDLVIGCDGEGVFQNDIAQQLDSVACGSGIDSILQDDVEATIRNVGSLARNGMVGTDQEIIRIMVEGQ